MLSFVVNRRIGTKIGAGFAVVLLVFTVSSIAAWRAFETAAAAVGAYAGLANNSAIYRDIDLAVTQYRGFVREYFFSDDESAADAAANAAKKLNLLIADGQAKVGNPARHRLLEEMAKQEAAYDKGFQSLRAMNIEQKKLDADVLGVVGNEITDGFTVIAAEATNGGIAAVAQLAIDGRRQTLMLRLDVNRRLDRHDEAAGSSADQHFNELRPNVAMLDAATKASGDLHAAVQEQGGRIEKYQAAFERAASLDSGQIKLMNGAMREAGTALAALAVKAKDGNFADQQVTERTALAATDGGRSQVMMLGLAGLAVSVVLAWLISRGIAGPVVRMAAAMHAVAKGDTSVAIPGVGRHDEIGRMADTVQVFKDNLIETERLHAEHERSKAEAEASRRQGLLRLAAEFEAGIRGVVNSVAAQATEMQSAAQSMANTAQSATMQATAVAAAVEQASTNVQTVASSAEELSASVREIGQQVERSSKIAGQAVTEAEQTNTTVEGLNRTAQRIGEVVQLIETIAVADQPAGAQRHDRGGAGRRCRQGLRGGGQRGEGAGQPDRQGDQRDHGADRRDPGGDCPDRGGDSQRSAAPSAQMSEISTTIASAVEEQGAATQEIAAQRAAGGPGAPARSLPTSAASAGPPTTPAPRRPRCWRRAGELSMQSETLRHDVDDFLATVRAA